MKKKLYSVILTAAIATGTLVPFASAEGDSVTIKTPSKIFAGATFTLVINSEYEDFSYQWLSADSADGEFKEILTDTNSTYIVTPRDKGKYIKARITNNETGEVILSDEPVFVEKLGPVSRTSFDTENINNTMLTPAENKFSVGGYEFILLDEFDDSDSCYYVMTETTFGAKPFDTNKYAKFDPDADGNIARFLNGEFLTSGNAGKILPEEIQKYINFDHIWYTEGGLTKSKDAANSADCTEDYSFTAGISLLSQSEAIKYRSKYGWQAEGQSVVTPWWSRTQRGSSGMDDNILAMMNTNDGGKGNMWDKVCTTNYFIRPTFYLNENFFKEVKLKLDKTGDNIKNMLVEKYTLSEMEELYPLEDLISLGYDIKSTVISKESVPYSGGATVLIASMNDNNAVEFDYKWYLSDSEEEPGKQVYANTTDRYIIGVNDRNKYISVAVTPVYADGSVGDEVWAINKVFVDNIGGMSRTDYTSDERRSLKNNPKEYLFTAGGEDMILLDAFEDDKDALYVMTADAKGQQAFDTDKTQKFDVEDTNNIGHWLNNDYLESKNAISDKVQTYINTEHLWWTEAGNNKGACPEDYSFTAGIALLSRSEYSKYWGKFGWDNNDSIKFSWWLRTGRNTGTGDIFTSMGIQDGNYSNISANGYGNTWNRGAETSQYVRPVFYLTKDFLLNVKITSIGEKAAEAIRKVLTPEEFINSQAGYTENELIKLGIIESPKAKNVKLNGKFGVGATIKGSYLYYGEKAEGETICGFEVADSENGSFSKLTDGLQYTVSAKDNGKYIRFFVKPVNEDGINGEVYYTDAVKIVGKVSVVAEDVKITDKNGDEINSLSSADKVNISVKLVNCTSTAKKAWIMLYVYDKDSNMLDNRAVAVEIEGNSEVVNKKLSMTLPEYAEGNYAKLVIWDGLLSMNPAQNYAVVIQ